MTRTEDKLFKHLFALGFSIRMISSALENNYVNRGLRTFRCVDVLKAEDQLGKEYESILFYIALFIGRERDPHLMNIPTIEGKIEYLSSKRVL